MNKPQAGKSKSRKRDLSPNYMKENGNWKEWGKYANPYNGRSKQKNPYNDRSFSKESTDIKIIEEERKEEKELMQPKFITEIEVKPTCEAQTLYQRHEREL